MFNSIFSSDVTLVHIAIMLGTAVVLGLLNSLVFSYRSKNTKSFAQTLALLPLIASVIIFLVNDHLGVSVAVAGAFTLVRFRSVKGSGREMVAIFASMAIGMVLGMGYIAFAVMVFAVVAVVTLILNLTNFGATNRTKSIRITIPEDLDYEGIFDDIFKEYLTGMQLENVRTKNMGTLYELTYSGTFKQDNVPKAFIDAVRVRNGNLPVIVGEMPEEERI